MASVAKAMASPESGLEVRDRMWLKITIPNAFLGKTNKKGGNNKDISYMNFLWLTGFYRAAIMFTELKPCDLWEEKKKNLSERTNVSACFDWKHLFNWNHLQQNHKE